MQPIRATRLLRVTDVAPGWYPHGLSVGPDLDPIVQLIDRPPQVDQLSDDPPARFHAFHLAADGMRTLTLPPMRPEIHHVQPLSDGNWLVVGWFDRRDRFHGRSVPKDNARIYQPDGTVANSFYLGHSITQVQSAGDGTLWVGYSDEGGSTGRSKGEDGLARFDLNGNLVYGFNRQLSESLGQDAARRYSMTYCTALNVVSPDEIWLCYWGYRHLDPVVRFGPRGIEANWFDNPIVLPSVMAVDGRRVLFGGQSNFPERLLLMTLDTMEIQELQPVDADGRPIFSNLLWRNFEDQEPFPVPAYHLAARGTRLYILTASAELYCLDLKDIPVMPCTSGLDPHSYAALSSRVESAKSVLALQTVIGVIARDFAGTDEGRGLLVRALERRTDLDDASIFRIMSCIVNALIERWRDADIRSQLLQWAGSEDDEVRSRALAELGEHFLHDDEVRKVAVRCALHDSASSVRIRALWILIRGWRNDPDTFEIACILARNDASDTVRRFATMAIGRWSDDPRARDLLVDHLRTGQSYRVRKACVQQLTEYWSDDQSIVDLLMNLAVTDADPSIRSDIIGRLRFRSDLATFFRERLMAERDAEPRRTALSALAMHASDDPSVLSMVQENLVEGVDSIDRQQALGLLHRYWLNHPETLSLLWDRTVSDPDDYIRDRAIQSIYDGYVCDIDWLAELADILRLGRDEAAQQEAAQLLAQATWRAR
jgi:hypothetical protein